jgi:hypothetical protein
VSVTLIIVVFPLFTMFLVHNTFFPFNFSSACCVFEPWFYCNALFHLLSSIMSRPSMCIELFLFLSFLLFMDFLLFYFYYIHNSLLHDNFLSTTRSTVPIQFHSTPIDHSSKICTYEIFQPYNSPIYDRLHFIWSQPMHSEFS